MLPLSPYLIVPSDSMTIAASMMPIDGDVEDRRLALEGGIDQVLPVADRPADQVGPDAERVGVVDGGDQRHPFGRAAWRILRRVRALDEAHRVRRGALRDLRCPASACRW